MRFPGGTPVAVGAALRHVRALAGCRARGKGPWSLRRRLVVPTRWRTFEGGRDGGRCDRLRCPPCRPNGRARHQGQGPTAHVEQAEAKKVYEREKIPIATPAERIRHVVQATFNGRRIVIFSGGALKARDEEILKEARAIREGGGFGSIIGRNSFQPPEASAKKLLGEIMQVFAQ